MKWNPWRTWWAILDRGRVLCEAETEMLRDEVRQMVVEKERWVAIWPRLHREGLVLDVKRDGPRSPWWCGMFIRRGRFWKGPMEEERCAEPG